MDAKMIKKEDVIEFLQNENGNPGETIKKLEVEFDEKGRVTKFMVKRYKIKLPPIIGGVNVI